VLQYVYSTFIPAVEYAKESFSIRFILAKKEYLDSICDNIMEFQIIGDYMKMKELGLKKLWDSTHWH